MSRKPVVITGPSGVGKGTLIGKLIEKYPNVFNFVVSHTTRGPRPGEVDGKHYYFTQKADMEALIADNAFLEHACVHGNYYGTSREAVADATEKGIPILDIDVQGARSVFMAEPKVDALFVFIKPPQLEDLQRRLLARSTEDAATIAKRVKNAEEEIQASTEEFWHAVLVNDDLDKCFEQLCALFEEHLAIAAPPPQHE